MTNIYKLSDLTAYKLNIKMYSLLHQGNFTINISKSYNVKL